MLKGQQYIGTVETLADRFGCSEQLEDGLIILNIFKKRKAKKGFPKTFPEPSKVKVFISNKMTTCGGRAYYNTGHVAVHEALFKDPNLAQEFNITLLHEYAHMVAYHMYHDRGHGNPWRYVMQMLGLEPNIYHSNVQDFAAFKAAKGEAALNDLMEDLL